MPEAANHGTDMITKIVPMRPPFGVRFATPTVSLWVRLLAAILTTPPLKYFGTLPNSKKGAHRSARCLGVTTGNA
jgi:hypothetical protein